MKKTFTRIITLILGCFMLLTAVIPAGALSRGDMVATLGDSLDHGGYRRCRKCMDRLRTRADT